MDTIWPDPFYRSYIVLWHGVSWCVVSCRRCVEDVKLADLLVQLDPILCARWRPVQAVGVCACVHMAICLICPPSLFPEDVIVVSPDG